MTREIKRTGKERETAPQEHPDDALWRALVDSAAALWCVDTRRGVQRETDEDGAMFWEEGWLCSFELWRPIEDAVAWGLYVLRPATIFYVADQVSEEDGGISCGDVDHIAAGAPALLAADAAALRAAVDARCGWVHAAATTALGITVERT